MRAIRKLLSRLLPPKRVTLGRHDLDRRDLVRAFQRAGLSRGEAITAKNALFAYLYQLDQGEAGSPENRCMPKT